MAVSPVDRAGLMPIIPQDRRVVPQNGVTPVRTARTATAEDTRTTETFDEGWSAADELYSEHEQGLSRKSRWSNFQGRSGQFNWAQAETAPFAPIFRDQDGPRPFQAPEKQLGEPALNYFMRFSASLNEFYRRHGAKVGVSSYGQSPQVGANVPPRPSVLSRRTFDLDDPLRT